MFNYKKIRKLEEIIKQQEEIIDRQATFMPAFKNLEKALQEYETCLYTAAENECSYIHATMKTVIGMVMKTRTELVLEIRNEMNKITNFYIEDILKGEPICEEPTPKQPSKSKK